MASIDERPFIILGKGRAEASGPPISSPLGSAEITIKGQQDFMGLANLHSMLATASMKWISWR